jgi:hypothetical protein
LQENNVKCRAQSPTVLLKEVDRIAWNIAWATEKVVEIPVFFAIRQDFASPVRLQQNASFTPNHRID